MTEKTLRMNLLGGMHSYIMDCVADENLQMVWLNYAVPDCPIEDDLEFIAEDNEEFEDCCKWFYRIVKADNEDREDI